MKNEIDIQIKVPNQTCYLSMVGKIGENMSKEMSRLKGCGDTFAENLNVVLTEAMSNAIKHANSTDPDKEIQITLHVTKNELTIKVFDNGPGFDLESTPCPKFDHKCLDDSGRGLFIIRSLMDSVAYKKVKGGNVLIMKKELR